MEQVAVDMKRVLKEAALEALREYRKEEREKVRKGRLRNTRLLMDNYLDLIEHYENIKSSAAEAIEEVESGIDFDNAEMGDIIIQSIKRTKVRTKVMIRQIETVVSLLKEDMEAKGEKEKYKVIELLCLSPSEKKKFSPRIEIFDPFKIPFSGESKVVFELREMDACCACTACTACCACK